MLTAQNKPVVFYSYTLPSHFARSELAKSGAVVLSGLTHVGVAMRQAAEYARFKLAPPAEERRCRARDLAAHLKSPCCPNSTASRCCATPAWPWPTKCW